MSFSWAFQWYHSHLDPIWPDGTFKNIILVRDFLINLVIAMSCFYRSQETWSFLHILRLGHQKNKKAERSAKTITDIILV